MHGYRRSPISFSVLPLIFMALLCANLIGNYVHADEVSSARQAELEHLLRHDCGSCHGMTLKGGLGPSLSKHRLADKPEDYLTYTILHGRPGTAMPPWAGIVNEAEARWLATFIKANGPDKGDGE